MRHYLRYSQDGELVGCDTRTFGWPTLADPRDPATSDPVAKWLQSFRLQTTPAFDGWAAYDCPCPRAAGSCPCAYSMVPDHYYNGKVLFPKPTLTVEVDGEPVTTGKVTASPGASVLLQLRAAVPDHHTVRVATARESLASPLDACELSFTGGLSTTVELLVPQQGICGTISGKSKYVREFYLTLLGWE